MISFSLQKSFSDFQIEAELTTPTDGTRLTALFGRSGCGKTSIVNMIAGLLRPDSGHIRVDDRILFDSSKAVDVPVYDRGVGYVFQEARLFPHLTVRDNLRYGSNRTASQRFSFDQIVELLGVKVVIIRQR